MCRPPAMRRACQARPEQPVPAPRSRARLMCRRTFRIRQRGVADGVAHRLTTASQMRIGAAVRGAWAAVYSPVHGRRYRRGQVRAGAT